MQEPVQTTLVSENATPSRIRWFLWCHGYGCGCADVTDASLHSHDASLTLYGVRIPKPKGPSYLPVRSDSVQALTTSDVANASMSLVTRSRTSSSGVASCSDPRQRRRGRPPPRRSRKLCRRTTMAGHTCPDKLATTPTLETRQTYVQCNEFSTEDGTLPAHGRSSFCGWMLSWISTVHPRGAYPSMQSSHTHQFLSTGSTARSTFQNIVTTSARHDRAVRACSTSARTRVCRTILIRCNGYAAHR
ncbi:uncharacterized protein B0H18DRAFT_537042 [Fomitopsis serialis]|uniref:uncharacterized protein n=1 Tax=Fomitopsis serialis TaxID=139415 RepID=UPI0020089B60|nr:uncharacterized protein B0H18DRAFT_537042 [Neoantrodia serialis]KAH9921766.1 hypothetical protein B0H18DRAFT_537042 [Neoantrodia serialis]